MNTPAPHWIPTFSDYIRDYILTFTTGPKQYRKHIPGEHHFVSMYLVPRLVSFPSLSLPTYVNPDGMKAIPGDIVYFDRKEVGGKVNWNFQLGIEVKIGSVKFSRTEYNDWMRPHAASKAKPHLFVGIAKQGILIARWGSFAERFVKIAFSKNGPPLELDPNSKAERYTPQLEMPKIVRDTRKVSPEDERPLPTDFKWWDYTDDQDEANRREQEFIEQLECECRVLSGVALDSCAEEGCGSASPEK
jgi:hypothetical protein